MSSASRSDPPHIAAVDGTRLRQDLLGQLHQPYLERCLILAFRYNDFDLRSGRQGHTAGPAHLVRVLERIALNNVDVTVVTRDPTREPDMAHHFEGWYAGLRRLHYAGVKIRLHPTLHAKVYLLESSGDLSFFAVGSSNLTYQGMGMRWAELNVRGYHPGEFELVRRKALELVNDPKAADFADWDTIFRRSARGAALLKGRR